MELHTKKKKKTWKCATFLIIYISKGALSNGLYDTLLEYFFFFQVVHR